MKNLVKKFLFVTLVVVAIGVLWTMVPTYAEEMPLYGFTSDGTFFIHKDLIEAAGGDEPRVSGDFNGWERELMQSKGSYYVYEVTINGKLSFAYYCFAIGRERYIPHVLIANGSPLVNADDVEPNGRGGYNFSTSAVAFKP